MGSARPRREPEGMTDQRTETTIAAEAETTTTGSAPTTTDAATDPYARGSNGLLVDPAAARREERRGWIMLTGIFVGGGLLVVLASLIT
jgi:hypothetical protein